MPELSRPTTADLRRMVRALEGTGDPLYVLGSELLEARTALDDIARRVRPDDDGTWTDRDGLLESIGNTIESTGRKVWEVDTDD